MLNKFQLRRLIAGAKSKISVTLIVIILLAFIFGMHGGTPVEHGDTIASKAKRTVLNFGNPKFFVYPALMIYMNASAYILYEMVLQVLPHKLSETLDKWPYRDVPGHLLTLLFSIIGALSVYGICFLFTKSQLYSTIGSLFLITSPLWNANSHYITVDIPLSALCALTVFALLHILEKKSEITVRHMVIMGILIGLAASAKYNGAVIAVAVVASIAFKIRPLIKSIKMLAICGIISILVFFIINPFILINYRDFLQDFLYASNLVAIGHPGFSVAVFHHHLSESLYLGWNLAPILLSILGLFVFVKSNKIKIYSKMAILGFPIIYLMILLRTRMTFHRYALPILPFLAVFAAYAFFKIEQFAKNRLNDKQRSYVAPLLFVIFLLIIGVNAGQSLRHNIVLQKADTRSILGSVFSALNHGISSHTIGAGNYCMNFLGIPARKEILCWVRDSEVEIKNDYDIMVIDSFTHDRYIVDENMRLQIDFAKFVNGRLITISPYSKVKSAVPFSPMSIYSPYYPDLPFRKISGPYIEVYMKDPQLAQEFHQTLAGKEIQSTLKDIKHGYYFRMFSKKQAGEERKTLSKKAKKINRRFSELFERRKSGQL